MKLTAKLLSVFILAMLISTGVVLQGCGDNETVPDGSTITIDPSSATLNNAGGAPFINFKVLVRYADGTPIPYANINISGAFAAPAATATYQFYWYPGGDQAAENVKVDNGKFIAQTDKTGVFNFSIVVFGTGSAFQDTIYVTSGTASGTATISLTTS